ncbi:MAG: hypothetical protein KGJ31_02760 [Patescibacteria group bacterium]|nr:hypothetical protein [Patescibacteria group bacterium]
MNKTVISIFAIAILALGGLTVYSFSPLSRKSLVPQVNPASLKPVQSNSQVGTTTPIAANTYHNRDMVENYYTVSVPQSWQLEPNSAAGSYVFSYPDGSSTIELMDVPDNSTLELYILSQDEPALKKATQGYQRTDYQKITVNGNEAYQLTYTSTLNGVPYKTIRTYIAGKDHAGRITSSAKQSASAQYASVFSKVVASFNWENGK